MWAMIWSRGPEGTPNECSLGFGAHLDRLASHHAGITVPVDRVHRPHATKPFGQRSDGHPEPRIDDPAPVHEVDHLPIGSPKLCGSFTMTVIAGLRVDVVDQRGDRRLEGATVKY